MKLFKRWQKSSSQSKDSSAEREWADPLAESLNDLEESGEEASTAGQPRVENTAPIVASKPAAWQEGTIGIQCLFTGFNDL